MSQLLYLLNQAIRRVSNLIIQDEAHPTTNPSLVEPIDTQPVPMTQQGQEAFHRTQVQYDARIAEANSVSLTILIWGSADPASPLYRKRCQIRDTLRLLDHAAIFSEEWPKSSFESPLMNQRQKELAQAQSVDLIIDLYSSYGAIQEAHDFASLPGLQQRFLILVNNQHMQGYGPQGLLQDLQLFGRVQQYTDEEFEQCSLIEHIKREVEQRRLQKWALEQMKRLTGQET